MRKGVNHFNAWGDALEEGKKHSLTTYEVSLMTRKRDKIWTAIISTRQWFSILFTSEADALVDDFHKNPPQNIGPQSYSRNIHNKGD